jgi:hypothetical protein
MNHLNEIIFIYLTGRLFFYEISSIINGKRTSGYIKRIIFSLLVLLFIENLFTVIVLFVILVATISFDTFVRGKTENVKLKVYLGHILFAIILPLLVISLIDFSEIFLFNPFMIIVIPIKNSIPALSSVPKPENIKLLLLVMSGFIFTVKEATIVIRLVLRKMSAVPKMKEEPEVSDTQEFDRGKLIGILERGLIYFLIIFNQVAAIAIIIALKSIARFKEMDDKNFAEYFLIGSLLSIIVAVIPAIIVKLLR